MFLIGLESIIYTNFTISNIEIGSIFPDYLNIWIVLWWLALIILFVACIAYAFGKKLLNRYIFFATIILAFVSLFFFIATWFKLFQDYSQLNINKQTLSMNLWTWVASWSFDILLFQDSFLRKFVWWWVYIYSSTWNKIDIVIENKVYAKKELSDKIFSWMALPKYENLNWVFKIYNEWNVFFKDKVPFSIFQRTVSIYVPQNFVFDIKQTRWLRVLNVHPPKNKLNYYNYGWYGCNWSKIYFSSWENTFVCENSNINKYGRRLYIQDYLSENVDKIVPYKHSILENSYYWERSYYDGNSWEVHSFNWIDENTVVMKAYDEFLNVFIKLKVQENGENIEVIEKNIKEIEQKRLLEKNIYKDQTFTWYNLEYIE